MQERIPRSLWLLAGAVVVLNLLQASFTELLFDEAYYWFYARNLDWGYFDHPPMVALMVAISELFAGGELGVRLLSCLASGGLLLLLWKLVEHPKKGQYVWHFFVLVFSMTLVNAYGFFTLPDTPLLFFTALFLLAYKQYLQVPGWKVVLLLGFSMAALMYSKYHAVLVIGFVILSNPRLALQGRAWMAVLLALLLYTPHLYWLYANDFVSLEYHLFERPNRAYEFADFTLGYFVNLLALFGLTFPWMYKAVWKTRANSPFTRALLFLTYGVLLFFFISSFQRRVQTQWIIAICIPMAVLVFQYLLDHEADRKWVWRTGITNIAILLVLRLGLVYQPLFPIVFETHGNREWVNAIEEQVGDTPVVFENSYREAPMYAFYSGQNSFSLNNVYYRRNQYDTERAEAIVRGQKVMYIAKRFRTGDLSYNTAKGKTYFGVYMENFQPYRNLRVQFPQKGEPVFQVSNPYDFPVSLEKLQFGIAFANPYKQVQEVAPLAVVPVDDITELEPGESAAFRFTMPEIPVSDAGHFKIVISENGLYWGLNGNHQKLEAWNR